MNEVSAPIEPDCFLGVSRSLRGKRWHARVADARAGLALAQRLELPEIVGRVLVGRGIGLEEADGYLEPTLRALLPEPNHLRDMSVAADRLARSVRTGERIAIFGDYDVDGATSAALLHRFFAAVGAPPLIHIPDRVRDGYGPNTSALLDLRKQGAAVVVTVDCGITAFEPLTAAAEAGLDTIVVDHHVAEPRLPPALAIVNPNRLDETSPHGHLAAVGVTFLLVIAVNRVLREAGWYEEGRRRAEPDLMQWLDLVALGTVCDVVPVIGVNRALVSQGLKVMARRQNAGLAALADVAGVSERPGAYHAGFVLGPRINAGGRVGDAPLGANLLIADDPVTARQMADRLDAYNGERQQLEAAVLEAAMAQLSTMKDLGALVFAAGEGWHAGVIGIVASRLVERFNRPACVVGFDDGVGKGSGRSVSGVDLGSAIIAARQAGLLVNGGGHPMAAGFTVVTDKLALLQAFLEERISIEIETKGIVPSLRLDGALSLAAATPALAATLGRLAPFGVGNAEPLFALSVARVGWSEVVGDRHVRCTLTGADGTRIKGIAFRAVETPLGAALLDRAGAAMHIAGRLRPDHWQGRDDVQFVIEDAAYARPSP